MVVNIKENTMHVHEINPKKTIVALSIFFIVILIGFITLKKPWIAYKQSPDETLSMILEKGNYIHPYELVEFIEGTDERTILIDIRDKFAFSKAHIPGAINISAYDLTKKKEIMHLENLRNNGFTVILYGKNQLQANGPWMLFRQIGFSNIKVLAGGYDYYQIHKNNLKDTKNDTSYIQEIADFDYAELSGKENSDENNPEITTNKTIKVRRKKKQSAVSGGC